MLGQIRHTKEINEISQVIVDPSTGLEIPPRSQQIKLGISELFQDSVDTQGELGR